MSNIQLVKIFNQVMDEFFTELQRMFPEDNKIRTTHDMFKTICKMNIRKPCNEFITGSYPYLEKIAMKDEDFFLSDKKPDLLNKLNMDKIWIQMSDNSKDAVWKYIKSFFNIGIQVVDNIPEQQLQIINYIIQ
jgi:hypothetical protein